MKYVYHIIIVLEMISINLYTLNICSKKRKTSLVTWGVFFIFSLGVISLTFPIFSSFSNYGNGNGLFMLIGFLYFIPAKYLYDQPIKYTITVFCSVWIYTMLVFSLSVRIAYILPVKWFDLSLFISQTFIYVITFYFFLKFVKDKFIYILMNVGKTTMNELFKLSVLWFFCGVLVNFSLVENAPDVLKLIIIVIITINVVLSYRLFYSLALANRTTKRLREFTKTDTLTKLKNRSSFYEDAVKKIKNQVPFSIFFIDLDNFKMINDRYGHSVGDDYLVLFANTVKDTFGNDGILYRISGDEFVFIFEGENVNEFCITLENLKVPKCRKDVSFQGLSIGYSSFPMDGRNLNDLIQLADLHMYKNKKRIFK